MLKSLYPGIDWQTIQAVGFDLDGTLYDEFEFICQVYRPIAQTMAAATETDAADMYRLLLRLWLEKGSSYNRLFAEVLADAGLCPEAAACVIEECIALFRHFRPTLQLSARVAAVLDVMAERFPLFLVTDGSCALQRAKIDALNLAKWFQPENMVISGCLPVRTDKPATVALNNIAVFSPTVEASKVVFFGDRSVDRLFAETAGFQFVAVKSLWAV